MSLRGRSVEAREIILSRNPDGIRNDERWSRNENRFRRQCRAASHRQYAGRALARMFCWDAFGKFALIDALAVADFEEGPVLAGGLRGNFGARERAEDQLKNERIGSEPADRPPPS